MVQHLLLRVTKQLNALGATKNVGENITSQKRKKPLQPVKQ